ncbi:aminotransferase class I/II-fold pyridoxal phosphate-dependent enzyme [Brevibacterium sp. 5221]|uniref:Histidinol-phosphate aminotransferase n=1 Tax=Brevibacterium rongguiense TaxID=2695267 RepID=A0A6N9HA36_9MICO|nr:histidinol-phosphate transaminase [Brevibacterium rongguiense]MYM20917.1 aminotransferase class I/II-fold pyridoxal phosphate-dependent enzyme [Brevibacterium rongguiense]
MSQNLRLRSALSDTPAYVPGKPAAPVAGVTAHKLSSNENHLPPMPGVIEAIAKAAGNPALYPDPGAHRLTTALAAHLGVEPHQLIFGAGASETLAAIIHITSGEGTNIVYPWPSFEMYPQLISLSGAQKRPVELTGSAEHDFAAMAAAIDDQTSLVLLCSPNNPTGPAIAQDAFDDFMYRVPSDVIVVLDQAYLEFVTAESAVDGLDALERYPNLVLIRTFSKAHGLAGLRVGFAVASPTIIHEMRKAIAPFSVTDMAQAAAEESLARVADVEVRAKGIAAARDELAARLRELGFDIPDAQGNFVWVPAGARSADFEAACREAGLSVRNLGSGVRVSIGPDEAMDRIVDVARRFGAQE